MVELRRDGGAKPSSRTRLRLGSLLVLAVLVVALSAGSVAAGESQQLGPCPGQNPNVGLENANEQGAVSSLKGIVQAATVIGCEPIESPEISD